MGCIAPASFTHTHHPSPPTPLPRGEKGGWKVLPTDVVRFRDPFYNHSHVARERLVPELPEVETVVRELRPRLVGRILVATRISKHALRRPWSKGWARLLAGRRVEEVRRRGKWIVLALSGGLHLVFHLGMTGRLTVESSGKPAADHTHLVIDLDDGREQLRFRDVRRFGSATLFRTRRRWGASSSKRAWGRSRSTWTRPSGGIACCGLTAA